MSPEVIYLVGQILKKLQVVIDGLLYLIFGYRTASGWEDERKRHLNNYETSAQIVRKIGSS